MPPESDETTPQAPTDAESTARGSSSEDKAVKQTKQTKVQCKDRGSAAFRQFLALAVKDLRILSRSKKRCCCEMTFPLFILPITCFILLLGIKQDNAYYPINDHYDLSNDTEWPEFAVSGLEPEQLDQLQGAALLMNAPLRRASAAVPTVRFSVFEPRTPRFAYTLEAHGQTVLGAATDSSQFKTGWTEDNPYVDDVVSLMFESGIRTAARTRGRDDKVPLVFMLNELLLVVSGNVAPALFNSSVVYDYLPAFPGHIDFMTMLFAKLYLAIVLCSLIPMAIVIKDMVAETENDIKTYLMVMGMSRINFYLSHFVFSVLKMTLIMVLAVLPIVIKIKPFVRFVFLLFTLQFVLVSVAFALFCATLFRRPGLAISVNLLTWLGLTAISFTVDVNRLHLGMSSLCALSPIGALKSGMEDLVLYLVYDAPASAASRFLYQFNIVHAVLFLILDTIVIVGVTILLDYVLPSSVGPGLDLLALFRRITNNDEDDEHLQDSLKLQADDFEPVQSSESTRIDIEVTELRKEWENGEVAVRGVNFEAFRGEVTALLGHNGAGKSTTFSCLTGFTSPTSGTVRVCGYDVTENISDVRKSIGYCPQGNPLFDKLTGLEHLRLAAKLRGAYCGDDDCLDVLEKVGLEGNEDTQAEYLSGGMKRKLCVAMALVGKSRVVLLDEPTAGMDPTARKQIGEILEKFKQNRTILLTTHYMDEADELSDRILIMVKGKVTCSGSSSFLKNRFGTGFLLTITLKSGANAALASKKVLESVHITIAGARFDGSPAAQFTINLPYEEKDKFADLFANLESKKDELEIDTFGLSVNTLEQVFIKVGEQARNSNSKELAKKIAENAEVISEQDADRAPNLVQKMNALCYRNLLYMWRHPLRTAVPFFVMLCCFIFLGVKHTNPQALLDTATHLHTKTVTHRVSDLPYSTILTNQDDLVDGINGLHLKQCGAVKVPMDEEVVRGHFFDVPPHSLGIFEQEGEVQLRGSPFLYNSPILAISLYTNLMFGNDRVDNILVSYEGTSSEINKAVMQWATELLLNALFTTFGLTFAMAMMLSDIITERTKKFRHQLFLASSSPATYWSAQFITDFAYFGILAILVFVASTWTLVSNFSCAVGVLPVWLLYFVAASLANYSLSFLFESPTKGTVFILSFHTIIPLITEAAVFFGIVLVKVVFHVDLGASPQLVTTSLGVLLPAMALFRAQGQVVSKCPHTPSFSAIYRHAVVGQAGAKPKLMSEGVSALTSLVLSVLLYLTVLVLVETKLVARAVHRYREQTFADNLEKPKDNDEDVEQEEKRVHDKPDTDFSLVIRNLYKYYSANKCAVANLTFGMAQDECFGLLGVNGAGKTTTFDVLTNQSRPTSGRAAILGEACERTPPIGYCPQFDALSDVLTGAETLRLLGQLNGFRDVEARVRLVLECVMLEQKADQQVKTYSGGQKRRLSIAVALMSGSGLLVLDEPTAGVDPATRRQIWDLLTAMREQNKAILLTTHSMEECEALCTRIGFLRAGRLRGIGTSQHLKSRYGNSYLLTLILSEASAGNAALADEMVTRRFGVQHTDSSPLQRALTWTLPRKADSVWSRLYREVADLVVEVNRKAERRVVAEFYLVQDSLEQVFTRLANKQELEAQKKKVKGTKEEKQVVVQSSTPESGGETNTTNGSA